MPVALRGGKPKLGSLECQDVCPPPGHMVVNPKRQQGPEHTVLLSTKAHGHLGWPGAAGQAHDFPHWELTAGGERA